MSEQISAVRGRFKVAATTSALRTFIHANGLRTGDRLPPDFELARTLGVARMTLRRAQEELIREQSLQRRHGVGTFVQAPVKTHVGLLIGAKALMPDTAIFSQWIIRRVKEWGEGCGVETHLYVLNDDGSLTDTASRALMEKWIQGALLLSMPQEAEELREGVLRKFENEHIPVVGLMKNEPDSLYRVNFDTAPLIEAAMQRLREEGHLEVGLVGVTEKTWWRTEALRVAQSVGLRIEPQWQFAGDAGAPDAIARGKSIFEEWRRLDSRPGAMLFCDHFNAMGFMHAHLGQLQRIPDSPRLALIEAKNATLSLPWPVMRVRFDAAPVVDRAMMLLSGLIAGNDAPERKVRVEVSIEWAT